MSCNKRPKKRRKSNSVIIRDCIQLTFNFAVPGNESIKSISDSEIIERLIRTSNPKLRAKTSIPPLKFLSESLFQEVYNGLLREYYKRSNKK